MKRIREIENQWNAPLDVKILAKTLRNSENIYMEYFIGIIFSVEREWIDLPREDQLGE